MEFEPVEYTVGELDGRIFLGIIKRNETDREVTVLFSTREGSALCKSRLLVWDYSYVVIVRHI